MTDPTPTACPGPRAGIIPALGSGLRPAQGQAPVGTQAGKDPADMTDAELAGACEREMAEIDEAEAATIRYGIG